MSVCVYVVCVVHLSMVAYFFIKTLTLTFKYSKIVFICVGMHATVCIWRWEDNFWESDFSSYHVDSGDWTLEVRLDCQVPIPVDPSHLDLLNGNYLMRLQKDRLLSIFWTLYGQVYFREALICFSFHISVMPAFDWTEIKSFFFSRLHVPVEQDYGNSIINQTAALGSLNGQPSGEVHQRVGWLSLRTIRWQRFRENV